MVPESFQEFSEMEALNIPNNQIEALPNLSSLPLGPLGAFNGTGIRYGLRINGNALTFSEVLEHIELTSDTLIYAPQDSIFADTLITGDSGTALVIDEGITDNVYQWYKDGQPYTTITGYNELIFPNIQSADAGVYWVHVTHPGAPELTLESGEITLEVEMVTSLEAPAESPVFQLYPNPAKRRLQVEVEGVAAPLQVRMANLLGREVWRGVTNSGTVISLPDLPAGMYWVELRLRGERLGKQPLIISRH